MTVWSRLRQRQKSIFSWVGGLAGVTAVMSALWVDFDQSDDVGDLQRELDSQRIEIAILQARATPCVTYKKDQEELRNNIFQLNKKFTYLYKLREK
jgi:hypothetical protein